MSAARPGAKHQHSAAAAAARKDSVDSLGSEVEDLQLESGNESADAAATGTPAAGSGAAKKKRNKKKKKKAAAAAAVSKDDSDVDEPASDIEPLSEEDIAAAPAPPTQPPPPSSDDDMMLTASGKQLPMHREVWGRWSMSDYAAIKVRGLDYMEDAVKISPPCPPTMEIVHLEIYMCDTQVFHVCSKKDNWLQQYKRAQAAKNGKNGAGAGAASSSSSSKSKPKKSPSAAAASSASAASSSAAYPADPYATAPPLPDLSSGEGLRPFDPDFFFVVNFHVQTAPSYHLTMYFQRREVALANRAKQNGAASAQAAKASEEYHEPVAAAAAKQAFDTLFARFIQGDTAFRNSRLKLIPFVVDGGNWFVTKAVGNRPCIIGNKITTTYHCDAKLNYMEVDIDVSGSSIGSGIFRVVKGYAAYLTLDLTLLIEGQEDDELPEVILGGCRLRRVDLSLPEMRPTPTE